MMSSRIPKTGRSTRLREWMRGQKTSWTAMDLYVGVGALPGAERIRVRRDVDIYLRRGEISIDHQAVKRNQRQNWYRYNQDFRLHDRTSALKNRILKGMYIATTFTASDVRRLSDAPDRSFIYRIARHLLQTGHLHVVGRRPCATGQPETLYHIPNRDKFNLEVMR